jgi:glycopeptide antibiotics resistance protein
MSYPPALVPFRLFLLEDAIWNTLMYAPLGLLLGLMVRSSSYAALFGSLLVILGVSAIFEIAQLFLASRFSSVDDTIYNAVGGGVGLALAHYGRRRRRARA